MYHAEILTIVENSDEIFGNSWNSDVLFYLKFHSSKISRAKLQRLMLNKLLGGLWSMMNNIKETSKWANNKTEKKSVFNLFTNLFIYTNNLSYLGRLIVLTLTDNC